MNGRQALYVLVMHASIAFVMIIAATILTALHDLDAATVAALFGTAVGLAGGSASSLGTLSGAVNGKSLVSSEVLTDREQTLRQAVSGTHSATISRPPAARTPEQ